MLHSPDALAALGAWASLIFLAPAEATLTRSDSPAALARAAQVAACDAPTLSLPDSIGLEEGLQPIVRSALAHSPKFRQQCRVLAAAAPRLRASVSVTYGRGISATRARTSLRQSQGGALAAEIEIRSAPELTELLAHEFEHLIEQLDGVDLKTLTKQGMAHRLADGAFETARAIAAGQQVAGEVTNNAPDSLRRAGNSLWRALRRAVGARASSR